jgi:hypothetical protein
MDLKMAYFNFSGAAKGINFKLSEKAKGYLELDKKKCQFIRVDLKT